MKLFTVGPVEMFEETLRISAQQLPYFRTMEFSEMMLEADDILKKLIKAPSGAQSIYLTASGTGAMEAAVMNCFDEQDKLLIVNGGGFGQRFVEICEIHNIPYEQLKISFEENITEDMLNQYAGGGYTGLLVNIHETTIGKLYPMDIISRFCMENNLYLMVDAISSIFADEYDMERYHVDATIFSSQKALALAPGMSIVVLSRKMVEERVKKNKVCSMYFDFKDYLRNFERGQTPFTPAVGIFIEFVEMIKMIEQIGIEQKVRMTFRKAIAFRKAATEMGFCMPTFKMSNALTTIIFEKNAKKVYSILKEDYGYVVTPCSGENADKLLRIGHIGNVSIDDGLALLNAMKEAESRCK